MAADAKQSPALFDPSAFRSFRFVSRELDARGHVTLRYALDEEIHFVEELDLPVEARVREVDLGRVEGLLSLLHWVAGVSYFKTALPASVSCETGAPPPAAAALLEALGWSVSAHAELEADDLMWSYSRVEAKAGGRTLICSGDQRCSSQH